MIPERLVPDSQEGRRSTFETRWKPHRRMHRDVIEKKGGKEVKTEYHAYKLTTGNWERIDATAEFLLDAAQAGYELWGTAPVKDNHAAEGRDSGNIFILKRMHQE